MKKYLSLLLLIPVFTKSQLLSAKFIIPKPASVISDPGAFHFSTRTKIIADKLFIETAGLLSESMGISSKNIESGAPSNTVDIIRILRKQPIGKNNNPEYAIKITIDSIHIESASVIGAIHAVQSISQLAILQTSFGSIPCGRIVDYPEFTYRGLMLDVSRNFFSISYIKKLLGLMSLYKLNNLHLHLTDDAGWRLEITKYPELTNYAAWRPQRTWKEWWKADRSYASAADPLAYGGFYTKADIKEIIQYARMRGINLIPELEFPGHSGEVVATYPNLGCRGTNGKQSEYCLGNDSTFLFFENVLSEVIDLFPSPYIHIGGDEADQKNWRKCPKCRERMRVNHLKDEKELQSYAIKRLEKFISSKGRKLIGWDEILDGGLAESATVMSWRGEAGGISAAKMSHDVIMTPGAYMYFDAYQQDPATQPEAIGGYLPIEKVYQYNPVPAVLEKEKQKYIKGVQANLWTEYIPTMEQADYMLFPRMLALSEVGWTNNANKIWDDFTERMQPHYAILKKFSVNYCRPSYQVQIDTKTDTKERTSLVTLHSEQWLPKIYYTLDGSTPSQNAIKYSGPFQISGSANLRASILRDGKPQGNPASYDIDIHKAIGKKITYLKKYSTSYPAASEATLTDGLKGGLTYSDGRWQGFETDMDLIIDLEEITPLQVIRSRFMQLIGPGVYMPDYIEVSVSEDGKQYSPVKRCTNDISIKDPSLLFKIFTVDLTGFKARYVRFFAKNHSGFLFTDEIVVD